MNRPEKNFTSPQPSLLWIGRTDGIQMASSYGLASEVCDLKQMNTIREAIRAGRTSPLRGLRIVLAQSRRGEFSHHDVARLQATYPLARCMALLGSWCEGEPRSGTPWPGVHRIYANQWPQRLVLETEMLALGLPSLWTLPPTATEVDRTNLLSRLPLPQLTGSILIATNRHDTFAPLADLFASLGLSAIEWPSSQRGEVSHVDAILWDAPRSPKPRVSSLKKLQAQFPSTPIIALVDFPRPDDAAKLQALGITQVIARPCYNDELAQCFTNLKKTGIIRRIA